MNKILILIPADNARGGITNYYRILKQYFSNRIVFQYRGARNFPYKKRAFQEYLRLLLDYLIFIRRLFDTEIELIQTTTSLNPNAVRRDALYVYLAKAFKKRVIVFFRGWDLEYAKLLQSNQLFKRIYFKADACIVLTKQAKSSLLEWGYDEKIYLGSTAVDDNLISEIDESFLENKYDNIGKQIDLLFLARIEKGKGIYELVDALELLSEEFYNLQLTIAGDGTEEKKLREYVQEKKLSNITFVGYIEGKKKKQVLTDNHIFVFPSYTEGMPTSVIEAMAFGLPVVSTKVGALNDFFKNGKHGFISDLPPNPDKIATDIKNLLKDKELMQKVSLTNYLYSKEHFLASQIVRKNEEIFQEIING